MLTGAMIMVSVAPASAATARATTMKLEKTQGTVTLKTQNGSALKITKGMRLYNGNTLATAKYSYAHISLDSTKAVKLDQSSSATLRQSGKQLELLVKSGKLFFNVSKKLSTKESMNVRTSTMVTGVRGTCGVVEYVNQNKSKLYLIEGQVTLGTGQNATVVQGGQVATVILEAKPASTDPGKPGETPVDPEKPDETDKEVKQKVIVEKLTEKTIPPVALQEIVADPVLKEKIEQTTELKIEKIEEALEQFEAEEAERIEQEKAEQEKEEEKDKDKEQEDKKEDENTTSSGGGSYTPSTPVITETTLSGTVTRGAIQAAFQDYQRVHIGTNATMQFSANDTLTIPGGKMLHIWGKQEIPTTTITVGDGTTQGLLCVVASASLTAGTINVMANSRLEDHGTLSCASLNGGAKALLINNKQLTVTGNMHLSDGTAYENHGTLIANEIESDGGATIKNTSLMRLGGSYISKGSDTYLDDAGAAVISTNESTAMPTGNQNGSLLMSAGNSYYYYARSMNQLVRDNMSLAGTGITWKFAKDAEIPVGGTVELANFKANMGNYSLLIIGTLTLSGATSIEGSSSTATVRVMGGKLILADSSDSSATETIKNTGSGYAIGWGSGTMEWNDASMQIISAAGKDHIMQGVQPDDNGTVLMSSASYCVKPTDYVIQCDVKNNTLKLLYLPASFEKSSDNLTVDRLNAALEYYSSVKIGENMSLSMSSGQTVTIPTGRTLHIASKESGTDDAGYRGSVSMEENANIILENNATLKVSGTITGNGTIGNTADVTASYITVESTGTIRANEILLKGCNLDNSGTIDAGTITTDGTETINNYALIKTQEYSHQEGTTGTGTYNGRPGSVLVNNSDLRDLVSGASLLAYANISETDEDGLQYFYSDSNGTLGTKMAERIHTIKTHSGVEKLENANAVWWHFKRDALVPSDAEITLTDFNAAMGAHIFTIKGTLKLSGATFTTDPVTETITLPVNILEKGQLEFENITINGKEYMKGD